MTTTAPRPTLTGALRGRLLKLAERATTPLVPADYLDVIDPLRSGATLRGRIVAIQSETADAATVTIKPGRDWPGRCPRQSRPGLMVIVAASVVSGWMAMMRPRSVAPDRSGSITSR